MHDDDDDGDIYFVGTHVVKRCLRPRSHGSGSRRLNSAAIVCMFHQRSIARSLRSASRWGSICRRLRSAAIALIAADTFHPLRNVLPVPPTDALACPQEVTTQGGTDGLEAALSGFGWSWVLGGFKCSQVVQE